ncbi:MAG: rhomboid family intramembrane serine protease [Planctomycetia bacterium]|nr:rhomboid family intramembrane serine protease [Planctomycetia bacterium]
MIIPIGTDAPLYHWPWMTLVLIGLNLVTFLATGFGHDYDGWILSYGNGMHPIEWLAYSFFHVNGMHLLTNMFFLWGFGIVVEGKLGWWKFLTVYLGIAVLGGVLIQGVMLKHKPREMPRLQIANSTTTQQPPSKLPTTSVPDTTVLPQDSPPTNSFPQNSSPPTQPQSALNQPLSPNQFGVEPPQFCQPDMNEDDHGDNEIDGDRWEIDPQTGERKRQSVKDEVSTHDIAGILWGNSIVFRKPGLKGASIMVYALLAITLVWAPKNEITCFVLRVPPGTFEVEYFYFCGFRVIMQLLYAWLTSFQVTEEFWHFTASSPDLVSAHCC